MRWHSARAWRPAAWACALVAWMLTAGGHAQEPWVDPLKQEPHAMHNAKGKGGMEMYFVRCSSEGAKEDFVNSSS